jgi:hypothetical protein
MPIIEKMAKYIIETVVPNIQAFVDGLTGKGGVTGAVDGAHESVRKFGEGVRGVFKFISDNKGLVEGLAVAFAAFWAVGKIAAAVSAITGALKAIRAAMALTKISALEVAVAEDIASEGATLPFQLIAGSVAAAAFFIPEFWDGSAAKAATPKQKLTSSQTGFTADQQQQNPSTFDQWQQANSPDSAHVGNLIWFNGKLVLERPYMHMTPSNQAMVGSHTAAPGTRAGSPADGQPGGRPLTHHASGGAVSRGTAILVGENGPELFTPTEGGSITPNNRVGGMGMNVVVNVSGSVIHERDLAVTVRDHIAQLMRRRGLDPAILGV